MYKIILSVILCFVFLSLCNVIEAQTPAEILEPYKKYSSALQKGDYQNANKAAYSAWKTAEKILGENKTTGDLALNYALLSPTAVDIKEYNSRSMAFLRAIELGKYHQEDTATTILDRHLEYLTYVNSTSIIMRGKTTRANENIDFSEMENALDQLQLRGTWHEAVMEGIRTAYYKNQKDYESAIQHGEKARVLFMDLEENFKSKQRYQLLLDLGEALHKTKNYLDAGLTLQGNFQNHILDQVPDEISRQSENLWRQSWAEIYKSGRLDDAYSAGLCRCISLESLISRPEPILRIPPIYPAKAERSGEAIILFDVKDDGSTANIKISSYTEKVFGEAAMKAVSLFTYTPAIGDSNHSKRQSIPIRLIFTLRDGKNEVIPAKPLKTKIPILVNHDMISGSNAIITTGYRIRRR